MTRGLSVAMVILVPFSYAAAAVLEGVEMPNIEVVDDTRLLLNGVGLRTFSFLGIEIYVAGLYLERQNKNAEKILHSQEKKLLHIRFLRDVDVEDARKAWRDGFADNCRPPGCYLDPRDVQRFLANVPPIHRGDETVLLFTAKGARVTFNGRRLGDINDTHLAETLLATFIGSAPPTPELKRDLLGIQN
jgi:hypothetical protein